MHSSNALDIAKNKMANALMHRIDNVTLADFGILFNNDSNLYIDHKKLSSALNQEQNYNKFKEIMNNLTEAIGDVINYNCTISKELDQILRNNEVHTNKIDNVERKLMVTQSEVYKKFTTLEAKVASANYTIQLLEDQMRSYSK